MAKILRRKQKVLNERKIAHSNTLKSLPHGNNPAAYRQPGSMNYKSNGGKAMRHFW